jgi:hypothetical protein
MMGNPTLPSFTQVNPRKLTAIGGKRVQLAAEPTGQKTMKTRRNRGMRPIRAGLKADRP